MPPRSPTTHAECPTKVKRWFSQKAQDTITPLWPPAPASFHTPAANVPFPDKSGAGVAGARNLFFFYSLAHAGREPGARGERRISPRVRGAGEWAQSFQNSNKKKLKNPFLAGNVFVVSLAFADLVVAFYPYPLVLYALFHDGWSLGNTQCMVRLPTRVRSVLAAGIKSLHTPVLVILSNASRINHCKFFPAMNATS